MRLNGSDTAAELEIPTRQIAEKFVKYYWRQSRPFFPKGGTGTAIILRQNTGGEAGVLRLLRELSEGGMNSLNSLQGNHRVWNGLNLFTRQLLTPASGIHAGKGQKVDQAKTLWHPVMSGQCRYPIGLHAQVRVRI